MIMKFPPYAAPAFNELLVADSENTEIDVSEVGGQGRSVTLHHVKRNGVADFDLKNFVSKLFYDAKAVIPASGVSGWAFLDYRLQARYAVGGRNFVALNAVRDKGHSLDLLDEGESGALTLRPIIDGRIRIPKYEGFPVGASFMYKNMYGLDYSDATKAIIEIVKANTAVLLPWYYYGPKGGFISWGDGMVEEMTATNATKLEYMSHTYVAPGQYEIAWVPAESTTMYLYSTANGNTAFAQAVRNYTQFSTRTGRFSASSATGLQRVDGILPTQANISSTLFYGCVNLTYINPNLFSNMGQKITDMDQSFYNTKKLENIDPSLLSGLTNVRTMERCFEGSGITRITASMFALMSQVTNCSRAFYNSKLKAVPDNAFSGMVSLENTAGMFEGCLDLVSIGANVFNSSADDIRADSICKGCKALTTIQATSFRGLHNAGRLDSMFDGCEVLTALPDGVFAGMSSVTNFRYGCQNCKSLRTLPLNLFDEWSNLVYHGMDYAFYGCTNLNMNNADIFKHNKTLTWLRRTFGNCSATTAVSAEFFHNMPQLQVADGTFAYCGLTTLPLGMFTNVETTISLIGTFAVNPIFGNLPHSNGGQTLFSAKCVNLDNCLGGTEFASGFVGVTKIPADILDVYEGASGIKIPRLFEGNRQLADIPANLFVRAGAAFVDISGMFKLCGTLSARITIPEGLLDPLVNVTSVEDLFASGKFDFMSGDILAKMSRLTNASGCFRSSDMDSIPENVFAGNPELTDVSSCFYHCENLTSLPENLFAGNPELTDVSSCFEYTKNLVSVPENLFAGNPKITKARSLFSYQGENGKMVEVPESLFDNCPLLNDVSGMFTDSLNIKHVGNIFRHNPLITDFSFTLGMTGSRGSLTGSSPVTPEGYRLWERAGKEGYPKTIRGSYCFNLNSQNLTDKNDIPSDWKGR